MKTTKFLTILTAIAVLLISCSKGDTGPAGPAGANGSNGSANVTATTFTITPGSWSAVSGIYGVNLTVPALTNINTDEVSVSVEQTTGIDLGLPSNNLLANGDQIEFAYETGEVSIEYSYSSAPTTSLVSKVVVIPPAQ